MASLNKKISQFMGFDETKDLSLLLRQLFAEFIGTFLYLSTALVAGTGNLHKESLIAATVAAALAHGLLLASIIQITGNISGGHINPAITLGALITGQIRLLRALLYVTAQILGSILGSAVSYLLSFSATRGNLGASLPDPNMTIPQVFAVEFLFTFVLVSVFLSVSDSQRGERGLGSTALAVGLCVTGEICCVQYSVSMNPVRSLGPALVMNIGLYQWVYFTAPLLGGLTAGLVYYFLLTIPNV